MAVGIVRPAKIWPGGARKTRMAPGNFARSRDGNDKETIGVMLISPAYAQAAAPGAGFDIMTFAPLVAIFVVFYFLLIRPQQKKAKQHRETLGQLRRGDRVVTAGGIIGTVTKVVNDAELQVEIAEGVRVRVIRGTITDIVAKTEPRGSDDADGDKDKTDKAADKKKTGTKDE
jgi:preprotein translocase subunit YajC